MVYGQLFPKATDGELESLRRLGQRWKVFINHRIRALQLTIRTPTRNMREKGNGFTSNIHFGARDTLSGTSILRHPTFSCTFPVQTSLFLKAISTTGS